MELDLGLALPVPHVSIQRFDLNINAALEPPKSVAAAGSCGFEFKNNNIVKKRRCAEAFDGKNYEDDYNEIKTLSLLVWSGQQPNDEDDDDDDPRRQKKIRGFNIAAKNEEEDNQIVGWPPIKSWRKKLLHDQHQGWGIMNGIRGADQMGAAARVRNSIYVKVKMEGVAIGRKIDLNLFTCYQALTRTLLNMFAKYKESDQDDGHYILSYLDKEGDWLLAGDVPWLTFIKSVQRMEILKQSS